MQNHSFLEYPISNPTAFGYLRWMQSFDTGRDTRNALRSRMPEYAVVTSLAQPLNVLPQFLRNLVPLTPVMPFPNCAATTVASLTLLATVPRRLPSSSTSSPPIVHPPGVD